jgi:hypothetical protein
MSMMKAEEGPLAISQQSSKETMAVAVEWANTLKKVVEEQHMYADFSGKRYAEVEAWQLVLLFSGLSPVSEYTRPVENDLGEVIAIEAKVNLVDQAGNIVGAGITRCGMDSFPTRGRSDHQDKYRAAESAAQTWAVSKAARLKFSFVMKLAGYEATPADEMRGGPDAHATATVGQRNPNELCSVHNELWFKSGKMPGWAHKDGDLWCNYPRDQKRKEFVDACAAAGVNATDAITKLYEKRSFTSLAPSEVAELLASVPAAKVAGQGSSLNPKGFDELKAFASTDQPPLVTVEVEDGQ